MSYNWPLKDMFTGFDPKQKFNNMTLSYYNKHFRKPRYVFIFLGGGGDFFLSFGICLLHSLGNIFRYN